MICGIDPSLSATAICLGDTTTWTVRTFRSKNSGDDVGSRIERIDRLVSQLMPWLKSHDITAIYLEGYSFGSNDSGARYSAEFGGILRWHLLELESLKTIHEVAPKTLKKFVTGKGNVKKNMMGHHVAKRWNVLLDNDNEVDAFGLYALGLVCEALVQPATVAQHEAAEKVLGHKVPKRRKGVSPDQTVLALDGPRKGRATPQSAPF